MLTFPESRVVVGATRESDAGFDYRVTAGGAYELLREALRLAPGLAAGTVLETRVGFRPVTPDGLPLFGRPSDVTGLVVATGLGPTGLTIGPYLGALAAGLAQGEPLPLNVAPFDPLRSF
jgi:D-amino-acid dehydrogenase